MKKKILVSAFVVLILAGVYVSLFPGNVIAFLVNNLTEYNFSCAKISLDSINKGKVKDLVFEIPDEEITVTSGDGKFRVLINNFFKEREIKGAVELENVSFFAGKFISSGKTAPYDIFFVPFSPEEKYKDISFEIVLSKYEIRLTDFSAESNNVKIKGDYSFFKKRNEALVNVKISFSPEVTKNIDEELLDNILSREDSGWYSTVIDYKGNPAFLAALYFLAEK